MRILCVEDDPQIGSAIRTALATEGHAVDVVGDGRSAIDWASTYPFDLVILDLVLPGMGGIAVCRELRSTGFRAPILMVTALGAVDDRVEGLDSGADDYLPKPFAMTELLARVRALLRRDAPVREPVLHVGDLEIDPATIQVRRGGQLVRLTAKEFSLLWLLARNPGQVFSRDRLLTALWDADSDPESNVVEVYIHSLRRKVDGGRRDGLIETVRGAGYRIRPPATRHQA
jgi:DNA-binding response OmpR family regulator